MRYLLGSLIYATVITILICFLDGSQALKVLLVLMTTTPTLVLGTMFARLERLIQ